MSECLARTTLPFLKHNDKIIWLSLHSNALQPLILLHFYLLPLKKFETHARYSDLWPYVSMVVLIWE